MTVYHQDEVQPLVSVIIPVYNGAEYVSEAIDSALAQTYANIEVVVVDDGSTDNTVEVLKQYGERIIWMSQSNAGVSAARNAALGIASGRYAAILDHDDVWLHDKVRVQVEKFQKDPELVLVWGGAVRSRSRYTEIRCDNGYHLERKNLDVKSLLEFNRIAALTVMFDRAAALSIGGFDIDAPFCEDWDMWIRLSALGRIAYVDETVAIYRVHEQQATTDSVKLVMGNLYIVKKHRDRYYSLPRGDALYKTHLALRSTAAAMELIKAGKPREARALAIQSFLMFQPKVWGDSCKIITETYIGTRSYSKVAGFLKTIMRLETERA